MKTSSACICLLLCSCIVVFIYADDIDRTARKGVVLKLLREMVNQTKADTLNLPANATSIRENITDTFSCDNRTYGYYADVDNDCQIFHVCLTSQSATGRNLTYRWSFICPNETLFNQEVLTCTRPRDSIPCEESPMFYHLNDEIGKVPNDTESTQMMSSENINNNNSNGGNMNKNHIQRKKPIRKQNMIVENLMKEVVKENLSVETFDEDLAPVIEETFDNSEKTSKPIHEVYKGTEFDHVLIADAAEVMENTDRTKTPIKPSKKEFVKKPNKKNKDTMKPLAAIMRPEKESNLQAKPNNIYLKQEDTMKRPQIELTTTPVIIKPDFINAVINKKPMLNSKLIMKKEISAPNEEILKVKPQREKYKNINSKPANDNKLIHMKGPVEVSNRKPINKHFENKEYILSPGSKISKETIALKPPAKIKSDEKLPVIQQTPEIHEVNTEYKMIGKRMETARLGSERSLKRKEKKLRRGSIRFRADKV